MKYVLVFSLLFIAACASTTSYSSEGEKLYNEKCSGCHRLYAKEEFSKEEWEKEFPDMFRKSKVDEEQAKQIKKYLVGLN